MYVGGGCACSASVDVLLVCYNTLCETTAGLARVWHDLVYRVVDTSVYPVQSVYLYIFPVCISPSHPEQTKTSALTIMAAVSISVSTNPAAITANVQPIRSYTWTEEPVCVSHSQNAGGNMGSCQTTLHLLHGCLLPIAFEKIVHF